VEHGGLRRPARDVRDGQRQLDAPDERRDLAIAGVVPGLDVVGDGRRAADDVPAHDRRQGPGRRPGTPGGGAHRLGAARDLGLDRPVGTGVRVQAAEVHGEVQRPGAQVVGQPRGRDDVRDVDAVGHVQVHAPGDAAVPPLILVLDVGGVRPLHDGQPQDVGPAPEEIGHVELGGEVRVLAQPDVPVVEPHEQDALRRADVQDDATLEPRRGHMDRALVDAGRLDLGERRRQTRERHLDVGVVRPVPGVLHRPAARDGDVAPRFGVQRGVGVGQELEAPGAIQDAVRVVPDGVHRKATDGGQSGARPGSAHAPDCRTVAGPERLGNAIQPTTAAATARADPTPNSATAPPHS
jgi:hypothetical protein